MKYAEIRWYKFQYPDKKRPVLILTRDSIINYLSEVTIAPITSIIRDIPTEVYLSETDGMPKGCVINFDHIQTVSKNKIGELITKLDNKKIEEAKKAILFAFGFK
jgi:mRNA interferase MazF